MIRCIIDFVSDVHSQTPSNSRIAQQKPLQIHNATSQPVPYVQGEKRLLVKVVRAADLGGQQGCQEPYCVVELDEPQQKHQTSIKRDTKDPMWDEAFLLYVRITTVK